MNPSPSLLAPIGALLNHPHMPPPLRAEHARRAAAPRDDGAGLVDELDHADTDTRSNTNATGNTFGIGNANT